MNTNISNFFSKISKYPEEVQFYFESKSLVIAVADLAEKYNLAAGSLNELMLDLAVDDFDLAKLPKKIESKFFSAVGEKQGDLLRDFFGVLLLPLSAFLKNVNIKQEFAKIGGHEDEYAIYLEEFNNELEEELLDALDEYMDEYEKTIDLKSEASASLELFSFNFVDVIKSSSSETLSSLNAGLIYLLNHQADFKDELVKRLVTNQERLTASNINIDGKAVEPSIANWIKDFIQKNGSSYFNNISLTEYLTNSENTKQLSGQERTLLGDVFETYRNLKFFPQSMEALPAHKWAIVPHNRPEQKKASLAKRVEVIKKNENVPLITEEKKEQTRAEELKKMSESFPPNSLERRAIEQEIASLNK
ncbi:hypothetical protein HGA34_01995 [Candidatus Falkowbacteria bacterium]|nr:hypothetical protein [Candidatus Falkowbacteria bacterium]